MTIESVRAKVESAQFAATLGVASGFKTFEKLLLGSSVFAELVLLLSHSRANVDATLNVIKNLSEQEIDHRYENPNDTALATYLRAVSLLSPRTGDMAAAFVLRSPNIWWSRQMALEDRNLTISPISTVARSIWDFSASAVNLSLGTISANALNLSLSTISAAYQSSFVCNFMPIVSDLRVWEHFDTYAIAPFQTFTLDLQSHAFMLWSSDAETDPIDWEEVAA